MSAHKPPTGNSREVDPSGIHEWITSPPRCKACRTDCPLAAKHVGQYNKWLDVLRIYVSASQISRTSAEKDRYDRIIHNILLKQQDEISYKHIL